MELRHIAPEAGCERGCAHLLSFDGSWQAGGCTVHPGGRRRSELLELVCCASGVVACYRQRRPPRHSSMHAPPCMRMRTWNPPNHNPASIARPPTARSRCNRVLMSPRRAVLPRRLYPHTSEAFVRLPLEFNGMSHVEVLQPHVWAEVMPKLHAIHFTTRKGWGCPERYERPAWTIDSAKPCPRTGPWVDGVRSAELCYCSVGYLWWRAMSSVPDSGKRKHVQQRLRY